jgi:PAS domain S-box-containing protein
MSNILIIEDNAMNMEMAGELLENAGHSTIRTENAAEGIKLAKVNNPDLILMDLNLAGMDGFAATKILKEDLQTKDIPVVAFTAMAMQDDKEKAYRAGCSGFISKPIDISVFVKNIEGHLKNQTFSQAAPLPKPVLQARSTKIEEKFLCDNKCHKVLIVDDNRMNTEILKEILCQMGQQAFVANTSAQAFKLLEKESFDLILLDVIMPDMSGFDMINYLKSNEQTQNIPVIFISALDKTEDIVKGIGLGSYGYITKPFKIDELKARILSVLKIKDLQDELKAEKTMLEQIFRFSADGIAVVNSDFLIVSCNDLFLKWLDLSKEEVINQDFCHIVGHKDNFCGTRNCFKGGVKYRAFTLEKNSEKRLLEVNCSEINPQQGKNDGYILVFRDVTMNKEIEQQKETFVATLTHDLKTPVRAQIRALEMILNEKFGAINASQKEMLEETLNSNKYMFAMLDNLLAAYSYENKSVPLAKEFFDINNLIMNCQNELRYLKQDKNLTIDFDFEDEKLILNADSLELKRVIMNLLSNAINYTGDGGKIVVSSKIRGNTAVVSFIDNGKGISEEDLPNLFNKYQSFSKKFRLVGTGLGLYLSKHILENHNGEIAVESKEGKGSVFTFKLPVC